MEDLSSLLKAELVSLCEENGLATDGKKSVLVERLTAHLYPSEEAVEEEAVEEVKVSKNNMDLPSTDLEAMSVKDFVEAAYLAVLGREADYAGSRHYQQRLGVLGSMTRQEMLDDLFNSAEYKSK
tara:strand:+ start:7130 stop:7504 length:375 start_codon:yes stop_codon:yes gene_type:complete